jgi:hypothetical protein
MFSDRWAGVILSTAFFEILPPARLKTQILATIRAVRHLQNRYVKCSTIESVLTLPKQYPNVRVQPPPEFLPTKYVTAKGLIDAAALRVGIAQGQLDCPLIAGVFPTFNALFDATDDALGHAITQALRCGTQAEQSVTTLRLVATIKRMLVFENVEVVAAVIRDKLKEVVSEFPQSLAELEDGKLRRQPPLPVVSTVVEASGVVKPAVLDPPDVDAPSDEGSIGESIAAGRDVLDPFIVALSQRLMTKGSVKELLRHLVAHKCLMKLEDLIGHLHEEVLGRAAGKERVQEPEGTIVNGKKNKEIWDAEKNPFPGADARYKLEEFYQIKNKTGSAKGSDGEKLGRQFKKLAEKYPGSKRFYVSMIGRSLAGHRSMGAFLRTDEEAEVLVGLAAFQQLGRHRDTPSIVLDMVLDEFEAVKSELHYDFDTVVDRMAAEWASKHGDEDPAHGLLFDMITGPIRVRTRNKVEVEPNQPA